VPETKLEHHGILPDKNRYACLADTDVKARQALADTTTTSAAPLLAADLAAALAGLGFESLP
jgi:hypothetical protein